MSTTQSSHGRLDEDVAAEALANHTRCNISFVHDLFLAQYRSSLTCPNCKRQSNNFDPFQCVSLPLPQRITRAVYVTVVYLKARPKQVKLGKYKTDSLCRSSWDPFSHHQCKAWNASVCNLKLLIFLPVFLTLP